jgi:hypothetical protein
MTEKTIALRFNSCKNPATSVSRVFVHKVTILAFPASDFFHWIVACLELWRCWNLRIDCPINVWLILFHMNVWRVKVKSTSGHRYLPIWTDMSLKELNFRNETYSHLLVQSIHQDTNDLVIKATTFNGLTDWNTNWSLVGASWTKFITFSSTAEKSYLYILSFISA